MVIESCNGDSATELFKFLLIFSKFCMSAMFDITQNVLVINRDIQWHQIGLITNILFGLQKINFVILGLSI